MRTLHILLVISFLFPCVAFSQSQMEDEIALLAARGDLEKLRPLYDSVRSTLSPHISLYCRFALARGAGRHREVVDLIDSLERFHERQLDVRGLLALATERCEALLTLGQYAELQRYCDERLLWAQRRSVRQSRRKTLRFYQSLGKTWASSPAPSTDWCSPSFSVPISRDWPLLIPAVISSSEPLPFLLDTGHRHSLISKTDAEAWGMVPLKDKLLISTPSGWVSAQPALLPQLTIGELTLSHLPVFVVDDTVEPPFNRTLGIDLLQRLQHLVFSDAGLQISQNSPSFSPVNEAFHLTFSMGGGLHLQSPDTTLHPIPLDLALPDSVSNGENLLRRTAFLRSAAQNYLDFGSMRLLRQQLREDYRPRTVSDYIERNDYFGLLNNEIALTFTATSEEVARMTSVLNRCLEPILPLSIPQGLPSSVQPLSVQLPTQPTILPYVEGDAKNLVSLHLDHQPLAVEMNPQYLLSQISTNAVRRHQLSVFRGTQGRQWALLPELSANGVVVRHLLCLVVNTPDESITLGLDVLSRIPALTFGTEAITLHPPRQAGSLPFERLFVVSPTGLVVQDHSQSDTSTRPLRPSDYLGKTLDFEQMCIR